MAAPFGQDTLPEHWSYGVCEDGRVFFINEETHTTTWLHPRTGEPVNSGHMIRSVQGDSGHEPVLVHHKLAWPRRDRTILGQDSHNQRTSTYWHPVTGQLSPENAEFLLQDLPPVTVRMSAVQPHQTDPHPPSEVTEAPSAITEPPASGNHTSKSFRSSSRVYSFGKREQSIKRNPNVPVVVRGWLYKQDSSGLRLWKRKWFVLADYCLFYYKDSREESVLGSIPLPSYIISPVEPDDHISRKFAFKATHTGMRSFIYSKSALIGSQAEHGGMRTYFFSADTQEDMNGWIRAMNQAALMQNHQNHGVRVSEKLEKSERLLTAEEEEPEHKAAEPQTNHITVRPLNPCPLELEAPPNGPLITDKEEMTQEVSLEAPSLEDAGKAPSSRVTVEEELFFPASDSLPPSRAPSRGPSRGPSSRGPSRPSFTHSNGSLPEVNGIGGGVGEVSRGPTPQGEIGMQAQRRSTLEQVEHWVKVQKVEQRGTLPRRPKSTQPGTTAVEVYHANPPQSYPTNLSQPYPPNATQSYQTLPKTPPSQRHQLPSDYKYAQDRLSHFRLTHGHPPAAGKDDTVWRLYEWQQRQRYRHASPTAPLYNPSPEYPGPRLGYHTTQNKGKPRSIPVPPSLADIPPPGPPRTRQPSPRRPHTPADRVTIRPHDQRPVVEVPPSTSPRRQYTQKSATVDRRSMPPSGYITHTVSAPSLYGKTPEDLTLLLIQLRRHQALMSGVRSNTHALLERCHLGACAPDPAPPKLSVQVDDTYVQLKKDLEYLDLKMKRIEPLILTVHSLLQNCTARGFGLHWNVVGPDSLKGLMGKPVRVAESDVDVQLSRLCEQDKILQELQAKISALIQDKDKLESVLDVSHQQMEKYQDQPAHAEKIACQQKLLQEDVVHIRAQVSWVSTEMERSWMEYCRQEQCVLQLREALQGQMELYTDSQERGEMKRELWRIEDVMAGLSTNKANYKITINSVQNPERRLAPSVPESIVPSRCVTPSLGERSSRSSPLLTENPPIQWQPPPTHTSVPTWAEDPAPPRPPLPLLYDCEDMPPAVPPLPKEAAVIRHMSVRGLKRQSDGRRRDREGNYPLESKVELRTYLSEPELAGCGQGHEGGYQTLPNKGLSGSSSRINQTSHLSSFVTMRKGSHFRGGLQERPKSALERLYSTDSQQAEQSQPRARMTAEEQLERMKRHQKALVRERKRNLSQGERLSSVSTSTSRPLTSDPASQSKEQDLDSQLMERTVPGEEQQTAEGRGLNGPSQSEQVSSDGEWLTALAVPMREQDLEPVDFEFDISRELATPPKVPIPRRYVELELEEILSSEEIEARHLKTEKIKNLLAKSGGQNMASSLNVDTTELDYTLQQRERIVGIPRALASEASIKIKQAAAARASIGQ